MNLLSFLLTLARPLTWKSSHFYLGPAMVSRLLSLVSLCLLGARHLLAGVAQFPSHRVIEKKQAVSVRCDPVSGHEYLVWYQHAVGKEMKFLMSFLRDTVRDASGMLKDRFSAERTEGTYSTLKVHPAEPEDSGVYFCASSLDTVLQCRVLAVQNHIRPVSSQLGQP